jgi:hypothetical protein
MRTRPQIVGSRENEMIAEVILKLYDLMERNQPVTIKQERMDFQPMFSTQSRSAEGFRWSGERIIIEIRKPGMTE